MALLNTADAHSLDAQQVGPRRRGDPARSVLKPSGRHVSGEDDDEARPDPAAATTYRLAIARAKLAAGACGRGFGSLPVPFVGRATASAGFGQRPRRQIDLSGRLRVARAPAEHECERAAAENRRAKNDQTPAEHHLEYIAVHHRWLFRATFQMGQSDAVDPDHDASNGTTSRDGNKDPAEHGRETTLAHRDPQARVAPVRPLLSRPRQVGPSWPN
jgi:hypothetical protein